MKRVIIESPFAGDTERNIAYARAAMKDCLQRGEAPYASHLLYTQDGVLDDTIPEERTLGMSAGFAWLERADMTVVYANFGISKGMREGIVRANALGIPVRYRRLKGW